MSPSALIREAEEVVTAVRRRLPDELRSLADRVPVVHYDWPSPEILGEEFEDDIMGMFVGPSIAEDPGAKGGAPSHILLFLENIWDEAEGQLPAFRREVRITYLHELGHYFGWDEDDLTARGLD